MLDGTPQSEPQTTNVAGEELRQFVERIERLNAEKQDITDAIKEVFAEAKGRGLMVMAIRVLVKERKTDPDALAELNAHVDMYKNALGM